MRRYLAVLALAAGLMVGAGAQSVNWIVQNGVNVVTGSSGSPLLTFQQNGLGPAMALNQQGLKYLVGGQIFQTVTSVANAADTNFVMAPLGQLPANVLARNGDWLEIHAVFTLSSSVSTKTYQCSVGYTSFTTSAGLSGGAAIVSNSTSTTSDTVVANGFLMRDSTGNQHMWAVNNVGTSVQETKDTATTLTEQQPQMIACAGKDGTGNAGAITFMRAVVWFHPATP